MKLLFIRHGDPDYEHDTITERGKIEVQYLAQRISQMEIDHFYVSPLGRAQDTIRPTLERMHRTAETLPWLREFDAPIPDVNTGESRIPWDQLPGYWTREAKYYDKDQCFHTYPMLKGQVEHEMLRVTSEFDALLESHGYKRKENFYEPIAPNEETIAFYCHFGVTCVLLGHLLGISPMVLWHTFCAAPTSVTSLITEERREGIALFRLNAFGDTSHLYKNNMEPAFAARFCEMYKNKDQRHD